MSIGQRAFFFLASISLVFFCFRATAKDAGKDAQLELIQRLDRHAVRSIQHWPAAFKLPFEERFSAAPNAFVEYLILDNQFQGWKHRPKSHTPDKALQSDLRKALTEMPERIKVLMREKLIGVFLVKGLGGSAYTEAVRDSHGREAFAVIALDVDSLQKKANEWATWKEGTPYKQEENFKIEMTIAESIFDNRANALQYILLHEIGHALAIGRSEVVPMSFDPRARADLKSYGFSASTWLIEQGKWITRFDRSVFPQREFLQYYAEPGRQLPMSQAVLTLKNLEKTSFVSPYASLSPYEDFAESFVSYVHTQWMAKPWSIRVLQNRQIQAELKVCWGLPRCETKQLLLEAILTGK